ncbi:MAG: NAD(P)-binding protein [Winogradskyella sp.]|nr:FAD-dependent oxidoreductase [Winogradskyella sp.]MBT8377131.1 FAD-dependent oxidoreductase [Bacteroidia bacterium]NNC44823.1 NAD(P)-binding protein [Winogradskyella sp.]NNF85858.1 NAD(P)-binding protein [Winogradskyella sp.]
MERKSYKIYIVGAGVSGLTAAINLERNGYRPIILEATDRVGGRVKTDLVDGYQLDHGFQVLLDAYPKAQEYLDFKALDLQSFLPGAIIYKDGKTQTIGDPLRNISLLWPTLTSPVGTIKDKLKVLKLNTDLKKKSIESIFESEEVTTLQYLKSKGFSESIITNFFKPFFAGIFLEPELKTSSRMFEFVYKMFGEGHATLPKAGIGELSNQLKSKLEHTEIRYNTKVKQVKDNAIILENDEIIDTQFCIVATPADHLISNLNGQTIKWKSCYNLYFELDSRSIRQPLIGLIANEESLINNIFYHHSLDTKHRGDHELLSVTIVKDHDFNKSQLVEQVTNELKTYCNIDARRFIKQYQIKQALPDLKRLNYSLSPTETQLKSTIFLAGDHLLNGSLNAAMMSGERAAQGVIMSLEDGLVVEELTSEYL